MPMNAIAHRMVMAWNFRYLAKSPILSEAQESTTVILEPMSTMVLQVPSGMFSQ